MNQREQDLANLRDGLPRLWHALYQGNLSAGFDERQAFVLLQTWILSQCPGGCRPPDGSGPKTDAE